MDSQFNFSQYRAKLSETCQSVHPSVNSKSKRIIDIIGGLIGIIVTLFLAVPIAIAIKLDSPGPILYSQIRYGLYGKRFRIWKFRSMVVNADEQKHLVENKAQGHIFKNNYDPRITRIGYFLRRTSLDEFPQFWNVFKGDMSLVGTRPPTPDEVINYNSRHLQRLLIKPGLTGEWQVKGRSNIKDFEKIVDMDLDYQRRWTVLYDINLILKTVFVVLFGKGAY